jgi:hypothetical protein
MNLSRQEQNEKLRELVERFLPQQEGFTAELRKTLKGEAGPNALRAMSSVGDCGQSEFALTYPKIFLAIADGVMHGPMSELEVRSLPLSEYNLVFDATQNYIIVRHRDEHEPRHILPSRQLLAHVRVASKTERLGAHPRMGSRKGKAPTGSILELLRVLMEHPGLRITDRILRHHTDRSWNGKTLSKHIKRVRVLLGDEESQCPFIPTDENVAPCVSDTGSGYYASLDSHYLVIRYPFEVSLERPPYRPLQV